jgi:hypothetical protein
LELNHRADLLLNMSSRIVVAGTGLALLASLAFSACKPRKVVSTPSVDSVAAPLVVKEEQRNEKVVPVQSPPAMAMPRNNAVKPETAPAFIAKDSAGSTESTALLSIARGIDPEVGADMLAHGKSIYQGACVKCHAFKDAKKYMPERWEKILIAMAPRARLNEEQTRSLRVYTLAYQKL